MSDYTVRDYTVDAAPIERGHQVSAFREWLAIAFICILAAYVVNAEKNTANAEKNTADAAKNAADAAKNTAYAANTAAYSAKVTAYAAKVTAYAVENAANAEKNTADAAKNTADAAEVVAYAANAANEEEKSIADASAKNAADAEKNTADAKRNADNYAWLVRAGAGAKTALAAVEAAKTAPTPSRRVVTTPGGACQAALDIRGIWLAEYRDRLIFSKMPHHVRAELAVATRRMTKACGIRLVSDN